MEYLVDGWCLDPSDWSEGGWIAPMKWIPFESKEAIREAYFSHRDGVIAEAKRREWKDDKTAWAYHEFEEKK